MHKIFRYQKYSETQHRRFPLRNFSAQWDKIFSTEVVILPPFPLLSINFLATGNFLKHSTESFPYEIFRHCETKNFRWKILILPNPPFLIQTFSVPEINATVKISPTEISGTVRQKIFDGKSWYSPPPVIHKLFRYRNFWSTAEKGSPAKFFGTVRQKFFDGKLWHNPLKHKLFRYPKLMTHWRVPLRYFLALWDKIFSTEVVILPPFPLLSINFLATGKFLKHSREGFPCKIFRHCEIKKFRRKIMTLPPSSSPPHSKINFFATGIFLKHSTEGFLYEMFRYCKTKNFRRKIVT